MKEGRYEYKEKIGEGGMASVYRGVQVSLNRPVAIKVLAKQLSSHPEVRKRFQKESLIVARLNHPNIIHVIDKGNTRKGRPVFVMEYVEGETLQDAIRAGALPFNRKIDLIIQICKGLAYAHKAGVIHRDIKPANVIIDAEGNARLLDFGIACFFEDDTERQSESNLILGTEGFMAPEQYESALQTSEKSDIYSLGVLMFQVFTGVMPRQPLERPSRYEAKLKGPLENLILKCLEVSPTERPGSVEFIKNELLKIMQGQHLQLAQQRSAGEGLSDIRKKFALLDVIKENQFGSLHLFEDTQTQSLLVIKKRPASASGYKEAKILSQLRHPNIINIRGTSKKDDIYIIVMEYLAGGSLQDKLVEDFSIDSFLNIALDVCSGLAFAHKNRMVHGNLRPSNILFTEEGTAKISDFGLNEHYHRDDLENWYGMNTKEPASELSDIFSLGAIFTHMLTSTVPQFKDKKLIRGRAFIALPENLQALLLRMLDLAPEKRMQSVDAVISELTVMKSEGRKVVAERDWEPTIVRSIDDDVNTKQNSRLGYWLLSFIIIVSFSINIVFVTGGADTVKNTLKGWLSVLGF
ncbi:serine/threonine protein kinase [Oleiphilus messinensis]|uniref:Serine/threonine protein kinase n=1 Tax=Oleiphilus messinensis TaxID=141451 RepID=A0A1Y0I9I3_9GAMM|nr:serine/threonine-protein kinase [Oleiphilus messinensis]ARU57121.1 serine/threonine protein kinase [Oleiphilus messinensis]